MNFYMSFIYHQLIISNIYDLLKNRNNRSKDKDVLQIIHADVHGPNCDNGDKHFISVHENYSMITIVNCIDHKSEVYNNIIEYITSIENQTEKRIKKRFLQPAKQEGVYLKSEPSYTNELTGIVARFK